MSVILGRMYRVKPTFALATILCLLVFSGCSRNPDEMLQSGKQYLEQHKYREATIELRNAIKSDPKLVEAHYQLALAFAGLGQLGDAGRELASTVVLAPNHWEAQVRLGHLLLLDRKFDEAREKAELVLKSNPSHVDALILSGNSYAGLFHLNDSLRELRKAFQIEPRLSPSYFDLTTTPKFRPQPELAEQAYRKAMSGPSSSLEASLALANLFHHSKRLTEAEEQLKTVLAVEPASRDAQAALAFFYTQTQKLDLAEEIYRDLVRRHPEDPAQHIILADFYSQTGKLNEAAELLQDLSKTAPEYRPAKLRLASLFLQQRDFDSAMRVIDSALKEMPDDPNARIIRGRILLAQERTVEAIGDLQGAAKDGARPASATYLLAQAYLNAGDNAKAEAELLSTLQNDPSFVDAYISLAEMRFAAGQIDSGIDYVRQALTFNPRLAAAHRLLCRAYVSTKSLGSAAREADAFFREDPGNPDGLYCLGLVHEGQGNFAKAEGYLKAALDADPKRTDIVTALSSFYFKQKRAEDAVGLVNQAIAKQPNNPEYYRVLAQTFLALNDNTKAEEALLKAISFNPAGVKGRIALADLYEQTAQADKSTRIYEDLLKENPANGAVAQRLAISYFNRKSFDRALQVADRLLQADNKNPDARALKGRSLLALGKNADGIAELQAAVNTNSASAQARFFLGVAYQRDNKPDQAEAAWKEAIAADGRYLQAHLSLAQLKLIAGDANAAIRHGEDALMIIPELPEALLITGNAYLMKKDFKNAVRVFETLARKQSGDAAALERLGSAYAGQGQFAQAEARFQEALRLKPNSIESLTSLVTLYMQQGKVETALQRISQQIKNYPDEAALYRLQGQVRLNQRNYPGAEESYRRALAIDKDNLETYGLLGQLFMAQNSLDKAINEFENVLKIDSKSIGAHLILASIHDLRSSRDKAQFHYRNALKLDPRSAVAANNLAWLLAESGGNLDEALSLARTAMEKLPKAANVRDTIGWIYYKKGAYGSAVDFLKESVAINPENPVYHHHLGMSYFKLGDRKNASLSLGRAIKLNPVFSGAEEAKTTMAALQSR